MLAQHAGSEGPETLAELDLQVHGRLHLRRARVADDAAGAKGTGTELGATVEPANDFLFGHRFGDMLEQVVLAAEAAIDGPRLAQKGFDLGYGILWTQQAAFLRIGNGGRARLPEKLIPNE